MYTCSQKIVKFQNVFYSLLFTVFKLGFFESTAGLPGQSLAPHINDILLSKFSVTGFKTTALIMFPQIEPIFKIFNCYMYSVCIFFY